MNKPLILSEVDDDIFQAQIESGGFTARDLEILNGQNKTAVYPRIGLVLGIAFPIIYGRFLRRPQPWSGRRTALWAGVGGVSGLSVGTYLRIRGVVGSFKDLDDKARFNATMKEIGEEMRQRKRGVGSDTTKPTSSAEGKDPVSDDDRNSAAGGWNEQGEKERASEADTPYDQAASPPSGREASQPPQSRWSEIRSARPSAQPTTWDTIRQTNEKKNVPQSNPTRPQDTSQSTETDDAQDQFDALLEAERKIGQDVSADALDADASKFDGKSKGGRGRW